MEIIETVTTPKTQVYQAFYDLLDSINVTTQTPIATTVSSLSSAQKSRIMSALHQEIIRIQE